MKIYLFIFTFLSCNLYAQNGFKALLPWQKQAFPSQVIELKNKNYLCIISSFYDAVVRNKTKLVVFSPRGIALDSMIFSAPDKDLNIHKAVETSYGLCLMGVMKKDTTSYFWVVNLNKQLQIINEQFKPIANLEVFNINHALDKDSTIILSVLYKLNRIFVSTQGKINKKGEILLIKNTFGLLGLPYFSTLLTQKDSTKYYSMYITSYWTCDTSFNNGTLYYYPDLIPNIVSRFLSPTEMIVKNDSTFLVEGDCSRGSSLTNGFFLVLKSNQYTNFREMVVAGDTSYVRAFKKGIDTTKDGRFIYIGGNYNYQESIFDVDNSYLRLTKMDSSYNVIWTKDYGGDANYRLTGITATSDGGCIMYAPRHNHNALQEVDVIVIKVDGNGVITSETTIPMPQQSIVAYPNPSSGQLNFRKQDPSVSSRFDVNIFDMSGKLVFQKRETDLTETFDLSHLPEGNYMYQIKQNEQIVSVGKWVKIK